MNNNLKMSLQEFATAVSQEMAIDKKNVSAFIDEFQKLIVESLEKDKIVKINGLGTFKLVWVNPRKSVNVSTGEPIEIEGHYKLNFSPDKSLQESINIDDSLQNPLKKMAQQAEEMKDILKDMQLEEENKITPVVVEESLKEEDQKEENKEQIEDVKEEKPLIETSSLESFTPQPVTKKTKTSKKSYAWLIWVSVVCILLLTFGFVYYLYSEEINAFLFPDKIEVVEEPKQEPKPQPILISEIDELAANRTYTEFLTEVKLRKGTRLAYFAKEYYGHPDFWVYIYEANIDKLKNNPSPSQILIGTEVKIPKMPAKLVDATSKEAVAKAVEIAQQYINAEK
ncbi:MAG: HU family DNA-binding protein [Paludibacteraceae bacterium]|jgi:nucleoid DNA-binding protein|nr:HU family DNA-binding protein [Paludibacteraceae bacterium]